MMFFLRCEKLLNAITLYMLGNSLRSDTWCDDEVAPKLEVSVEYHQRCIGQCVRAIIPPMNAQDIRNKYLEFYAKQQHAIIKRAPLILTDDPTTLFTGAGMQPMIPYLLGETHPQGKRIADSQTCLRAQDIDDIGDNRHTTFFEMLGNWSLGDYFKKEQITWMWTFLTEEVGLDPNRLYVTCLQPVASSQVSVSFTTTAAKTGGAATAGPRRRQSVTRVGQTARCFMSLTSSSTTRSLVSAATLTATAGALWRSATTSLWRTKR